MEKKFVINNASMIRFETNITQINFYIQRLTDTL